MFIMVRSFYIDLFFVGWHIAWVEADYIFDISNRLGKNSREYAYFIKRIRDKMLVENPQTVEKYHKIQCKLIEIGQMNSSLLWDHYHLHQQLWLLKLFITMASLIILFIISWIIYLRLKK